jgi:hypothetical protein
MSPVVWLLVAGCAVPATPKPATAEAIIHALGQPANFAGNPNDFSLIDILQALNKQHGLPFVIQNEFFRAGNINDIARDKPALIATDLKGLTVHQFLTVTLGSLKAAYLINNGRIEIVPFRYADAVARPGRAGAAQFDDRPTPLLSIIVKQKPLKDVVASVVEKQDLSVVVSPKVGDAMDALVTARLLNVPADQILDRLVVACDLRAVRRGETFLITTAEHAKQLAAEQLEQERQKAIRRVLRLSSPALPKLELFDFGFKGLWFGPAPSSPQAKP